jgi:hypothetical protein
MNTFTRIRRFLVSLGRPYPSRDWFFALVIAAFALSSFTLFASYLFFGIESGSIITSPNAVPPVVKTLTRGDIQKTLDAYRIRKLNYDANNFPATPLSDPAGAF